MKKFLTSLLPKNKTDIYFWFLFVLSLFPLIYLSFCQYITYMSFNFCLFCVIIGYFIYKLIQKLVFKRKIELPKSKALIILSIMFLWIFIGSFFAQDMNSTWRGLVDDKHTETSVFQYLFYYICAVCALLMDKKNIKHLLYSFLVVINIIIVIQFFKQDYGFGFINKNHTGYYLSVSISVTIGLLLFAKKLWEIIPLSLSLILHYTSIILNGSLGPIVGLVVFFVVGGIYFLIHNRKMLVRFGLIILTCVMIFSFFDFVPKAKELRDEPTPVVTQLTDVGLVAMNKLNIISDEKFEEIMLKRGGMSAGADGYDRFEMWKRSLENMVDYPIFGVGVGAWHIVNPDMPNRRQHNEFLQYGAEAGIPVMILYIVVFLYLFIKFRKNHKNQENLSFVLMGAIITYLVQSVFGNIMPFTAPVFYVIIGLAIKFVDGYKLEDTFSQETLKIQENLEKDKNESETEVLQSEND